MAVNYELETINVEGKTVRLTDKQLTDRFNAEVTNRTNADTNLDNKINTEVTNRTKAISELKTNYTSTETKLSSHINNKSNPHNVTKAQIGLSNVDNVSKSAILLSAYPVGSIYKSTNSTSPAKLFGGTWEQIKDRFLLAAGDTYKAGSTGGEAQHILTKAEMPTHEHAAGNGVEFITSGEPAKWDIAIATTKHYSSTGYTATAGDSQPHNNMPPYLAVYTWKRVE